VSEVRTIVIEAAAGYYRLAQIEPGGIAPLRKDEKVIGYLVDDVTHQGTLTQRQTEALESLAYHARERNRLHAESIEIQRGHLEFAREAERRHRDQGSAILADILGVPLPPEPGFGVGPAAVAEDKTPGEDAWHLTASYAHRILTANDGENSRRARKRADILVQQIHEPFVVTTEHGDMAGGAGDYLACNDPTVDPGSDAWPISAERFTATYDILTTDPLIRPDRVHEAVALMRDQLERGEPTSVPTAWTVLP
jgi:hypothetical protein